MAIDLSELLQIMLAFYRQASDKLQEQETANGAIRSKKKRSAEVIQ